MKSIFTLFLFVVFTDIASAQRWKITSAYSLGLVQQEMKENIQPAHSLQAGILYDFPGHLNRLSVGAELGVGVYASRQIDQTFQFDNNTSTVVPVNYSSNVFNAAIQSRLNLVDKGQNLLIPYITAKTGLYSFFSNIYVEDPHDPLGCRALEQETIISDKTIYWSAGGGIQVDLGLLSKKTRRSTVMLDLGTQLTRGGKIDYINTKDLVDAQAPTPVGKPVHVNFVNASTQSIHEHTVAQVYTSPLRMLEIRAGIVVTID